MYLWYLIAALILPPTAALYFLGLLAFWPSHVFYTSQHLKESAALFLLAAAYYCFLKVWRRCKADAKPRWNDQALMAAGALAIIVFGFFRSYLIPIICAALIIGMAVALRQHIKSRRRLGTHALAVAWILAALFLHRPIATLIKPHLYAPKGTSSSVFLDDIWTVAGPGKTKRLSPYSLRGLSDYRRARLKHSQLWSQRVLGRSIQTQIFPKTEFKTWSDMLLFLPKAIFYSLFMPLPGLYPTGGKLGRLLASSENIGLLVLFVLAVLG
ncbi:unnamed protein product, partial [marine sediment metagenome]